MPAKNDQLPTDSGGGLELIVTRSGGGESRLPCSYNRWSNGRAPFDGGRLAQFSDEPVASSFAWLDETTCLIKQFAYETPFGVTLRLAFDGDQVVVSREANVAFGATKRPELTGRARQ